MLLTSPISRDVATLLSVSRAPPRIFSKNPENCGKCIKIVGFLVNIKIAIRLRISLRNRLRNRLQKIDSKPPIASTTSPLRSLASKMSPKPKEDRIFEAALFYNMLKLQPTVSTILFLAP